MLARPCGAPDGYWSVHRDVRSPFAGRWHLRVDALVAEFEKIARNGRCLIQAVSIYNR
jgi:hypothetical protein